jgi:hypothetical protein
MEQSLHIPSKSRIRDNKRKTEKEKNLIITNAWYLGGYKILISFSDGRQRIVNFEPIFSKYLKGFYEKFLLTSNFKKFVVANGNISWGKNEDVIFPVSFLYSCRYGTNQKEKVLYVF